MSSGPAAEKQELRKKMLAQRRALSSEMTAEMRKGLTEKLLALPAYQSARRILAYLALPGEADLDDFLRAALAAGKEVYVPVCLPEHRMEAGRLLDMEHFVRGPYGLRDLPAGYETAEPETLDLVLIPAVAAGRDGTRLGHGAGYYDRYLPRVAEGKRVGVLWDFQLVPSVPTDALDQKLCGIVTEKEIISVRPAEGV